MREEWEISDIYLSVVAYTQQGETYFTCFRGFMDFGRGQDAWPGYLLARNVGPR